MIIYMYGAMCLKYISGAKSLEAGISYTFWNDKESFKNWIGFDPYYLCILVFGFFSIYFSFGNIENSKTLQVVTMFLRFFVTILMCSGTIYSLGKNGMHQSPIFDFKN